VEFQISAFAGSLRRGSLNRALLRAAVEVAPPSLRITIHELGELPLYNADVDASGPPPVVAALRDAVRASQGLLIATPEYNHGVPGVLKNAIDWLSRPPRDSALNGKVAGIIGASPGMTGTARAQSQLRQAFVFTNTYALLQPEVLVARASDKFAPDGTLSDASTREFLSTFFKAYLELLTRLAPAPSA
jgi:chromate reductase